MTEETFEKKRDKLIKDILNSKLYLTFRQLDEDLYLDEELIKLNREKDIVLELLSHAQKEDEEKHLIALSRIQKKVNALPLVIRYYELKEQLKELIKPLNEEIIEKVYF